jgi:hypothetical protein
MTESAQVDPNRYEMIYRDRQVEQGVPAATPSDIGGPQQVVAGVPASWA